MPGVTAFVAEIVVTYLSLIYCS